MLIKNNILLLYFISSFISSEKRTNVLPHMPPDRRKFVHDVCAQFIFIFRRVDLTLFFSFNFFFPL